MTHLALVLFQIAAVLTASRVVGSVLRRVGQPSVVGEMVAGLALGPSVLGALAPNEWQALFPASAISELATFSQLGLVLFMFLVGIELDTGSLRARGGAALLISWVSIALPFALGAGLGVYLHPMLAPDGVKLLPFALFVGAAMSVTAFPVLVRILEATGLTRSSLGTMAIACAAVDDVSAWILLAIVVSISSVGKSVPPWLSLAGFVVYVVVMLIGVRLLVWRIASPTIERLKQGESLSNATLALIVIGMLISAGISEALGMHALFGAFLAGAILPRDEHLARALSARFQGLLSTLLLPLFFASTGLRTDFRVPPESVSLVVVFAAVLGVAVVGKLGGTAAAARWTGLSWRNSIALGTLMNTRGLMELVILNVGLEIGVLSRPLFSVMVLMAIVTTMMTSPLLRRIASLTEDFAGPHATAGRR